MYSHLFVPFLSFSDFQVLYYLWLRWLVIYHKVMLSQHGVVAYIQLLRDYIFDSPQSSCGYVACFCQYSKSRIEHFWSGLLRSGWDFLLSCFSLSAGWKQRILKPWEMRDTRWKEFGFLNHIEEGVPSIGESIQSLVIFSLLQKIIIKIILTFLITTIIHLLKMRVIYLIMSLVKDCT